MQTKVEIMSPSQIWSLDSAQGVISDVLPSPFYILRHNSFRHNLVLPPNILLPSLHTLTLGAASRPEDSL